LFVKLAEQGSTVLATTPLGAVAVSAAKTSTSSCSREPVILDLLGVVPPENVFVIRTRSAWAMIASCLAQLAAIRRRHLDACIDLEFFARSSVALAFLTVRARALGFTLISATARIAAICSRPVNYNPHLHASAAFASLLHALDVDPASLPTMPSARSRVAAATFLPKRLSRSACVSCSQARRARGPPLMSTPRAICWRTQGASLVLCVRSCSPEFSITIRRWPRARRGCEQLTHADLLNRFREKTWQRRRGSGREGMGWQRRRVDVERVEQARERRLACRCGL